MDETTNTLTVGAFDTVGKQCQFSHLIQDEGLDGEMIYTGVRGSAFIPDKDGLSVTWIQHPHHTTHPFTSDAFQCISKIRTVKKSHRLAIIAVKSIIDSGTKFGIPIYVIHDPQENYECHSLIVNIDATSNELLELLATECIAMEVMLEDSK